MIRGNFVLFRSACVQLREDFDMGVDVQLDEEHSVHDVAALLKEFLRDMPDPLLPRELYPAFLHANSEQVHTSGDFERTRGVTAASFSAQGSRAAPVPAAPPVPAASLQLRHAVVPPQPLAHGAELRPGRHRNK